MSRFGAIAITLTLTALCVPVAAQEPDEEPEPERWGAEAGLALNASGGNKELTVFVSELELTRLETTAYEATIGARFRYGRSEGEDVAQNLSGRVNLDLWPAARWSPFIFATGESDPFKKLDVRINAGGGAKRTLWQDDWDELSLSAALVYSYENLEVADSLGDGVSTTARQSWRARGRTELGEGRRLEQVVLYQPVYDTLDDYLLESTSTARWALTQSLAFTASLLYQHDSTPAPDVKSDDWTVALGFSLATRW